MACPRRGNVNIAKQASARESRAHLVRIPYMGCIDRSSKEVLQTYSFSGESVLGFPRGSFQVPYGVLQCIREHKSFVARRVADNREAQGSKHRSRTASPIHPSRSARLSGRGTGESEFYEFADISQPESTNS